MTIIIVVIGITVIIIGISSSSGSVDNSESDVYLRFDTIYFALGILHGSDSDHE